MNRRTFLAQLSTAAATLPLISAATGSERLAIGFLGATHSHASGKLQIALQSPEWRCVGVCDASPQGRATAEKLGAQIITQKELFELAQVVAIEGAIRDQFQDAKRALEAGKHIHLEKPGAARAGEMRQLVDLARSKNLLIQTGYMWRLHPGFVRIAEAVRNGWLGDVYLVRAFMSNHASPASRAEWAEFNGGSMFEQGSHLIDSIVRLMGKPAAVSPFLRHHGKTQDTLKDNNIVVFEFANASAILVNTSLQKTPTPQRAFEVLGSNGAAILQPIEPPTLTVDLVDAAGPYAKGAQKVVLPAFRRYESDMQELAAGVRKERPLAVSLENELLVNETILAASGME